MSAIQLKTTAAANVATPATGKIALFLNTATSAPAYMDSSASVHAMAGDALTTNPLSQFAATTSAQLAGVLSDETGSGSAVFGTSPTLSNPVVGTQSYGDNTTKGASTAFVQAAVTTRADSGNSSTAVTIDWSTANIRKVTLTGNATATFTAPGTGAGVLVLEVIQGAGPYAITWPAAVHWPGGVAPTLTATNAKVDVFTFYYNGTTYFGVTSGQNYTA